jgi:transposase
MGPISRFGDASVRTALYEAASTLIVSCKKPFTLRRWALRLRESKGFKTATIACARKLAVILHRMWITETDFHDEAIGP